MVVPKELLKEGCSRNNNRHDKHEAGDHSLNGGHQHVKDLHEHGAGHVD